jgi:hypothetical protein
MKRLHLALLLALAVPAASVALAAASAAPTLEISTSALTFDAPLGGPDAPPQIVTVSNVGAASFQWTSTVTLVATVNWLKVAPGNGNLGAGRSKDVSVIVNSSSLAAGTYVGTVRFVDKDDPTNFQDLTVTLHVGAPPVIGVTPATGLFFDAPAASGLQPTQSLTLINLGGSPLTWTAATSITSPPAGTWLQSVTPSSGTLGPGESTMLTVTVDASGLAANPYNGAVVVTGNASNSPVNTPVTLTVHAPPRLDVSPLLVNLNSMEGSTNPLLRPVTIRNAGGSPLDWTATIGNSSPWLSVTPTSGTGIPPGGTVSPAFQIIADPTGLVAGDYLDTVVIGGNASNGVTIVVGFSILPQPDLDVTPLALTFRGPEGGPDPASQIVTVTNDGGGTLNWTSSITGKSPWLSTSKAKGSLTAGASDQIQVLITIGSLVSGTYTDDINFDDGNGTVLTVFVTLTVNAGRLLLVSPDHIFATRPQGGAPGSRVVTVQNVGTGGTLLAWSASSNAAWLTVSPTSGSLAAGETAALTLTGDPAGLLPGTYVGLVTVTGNAPNSPQIVSVIGTITPVPEIDLTPKSLVFNVAQDGAAVSQTVTLDNVGGGPDLVYTTTESVPWLNVSPGSGSIPAGGSDTISVAALPGSLAPGTYTAYVTVNSPNALNAPQVVFVTMNVIPAPAMQVTPSALVFDLRVGGGPASRMVTLRDSGGSPTPMTYSASIPVATWISVAPSSGTVLSGTGATLTVTATPGALSVGTYTGFIRLDSANAINAPQFLYVTMNLTPLPRIDLSPASLSFVTGTGINPTAQAVMLTNSGGGTLTWSAAASVSTPAAGTWLSLLGTTSGALGPGLSTTFDAAVDVTGLAAGYYEGRITVTAAGASNTPQILIVRLIVIGAAEVDVAPKSLAFTAPIGTNPSPQTVTVSNLGGQPMDWSASTVVSSPAGGTWLTLSGPSSGVGLAPGSSAPPFDVGVDVSGLPAGQYSGFVRITGAAGALHSPQDVLVTLHVLGPPTIQLSPAAIVVQAPVGGTSTQTVTVTNLGDLPLQWSATVSGGAWLTLSGATSGSIDAELSTTVEVVVSAAGLSEGTYTGQVSVTGGPGTTNSPQTIGVTLVVAAGKVPRTGFCGSVGIDVAWPLLLLWLARKRRRAVAALIVGIVLMPAVARADEELPRTLVQAESPAPETSESGLLTFTGSALNLHLGMLGFSSDYKANPEVCGGVEFRMPSPALSHLVGREDDRLALFVDVTGSGIDRDIEATKDTSGVLFFATAGMDVVLLRTPWFESQAQVAVQYGHFGGVTRLDDGVALLLGLRGGIPLGSAIQLTVTPQVAFGNAGSRLYFLSAGLDLRF